MEYRWNTDETRTELIMIAAKEHKETQRGNRGEEGTEIGSPLVFAFSAFSCGNISIRAASARTGHLDANPVSFLC